mmetsp:Transcript_78086/g.156257  ORF Transcript_78086/g.156257 Transcript_78086/m.156257 type:complete len:222 (-) Transcript_78086:110-775(-)
MVIAALRLRFSNASAASCSALSLALSFARARARPSRPRTAFWISLAQHKKIPASFLRAAMTSAFSLALFLWRICRARRSATRLATLACACATTACCFLKRPTRFSRSSATPMRVSRYMPATKLLVKLFVECRKSSLWIGRHSLGNPTIFSSLYDAILFEMYPGQVLIAGFPPSKLSSICGGGPAIVLKGDLRLQPFLKKNEGAPLRSDKKFPGSGIRSLID